MATNKVSLDLLVKAIWEGKGIKEGEKDLSAMEKRAMSFAKAGTAAFATIGAAALKFGADSLKAFTQFEKGMNEVFTLLPSISHDAMESMKADVLSFAQESGRLSSEVVPALYQAISAGVPQDNVFDFMKIASDAALGGVTDLETAVDGITSVVNAYGAETVSAAEASDLMFTAVKLGKTNFEQLSRFMFQVTPIASALGVEFGNVTAALAALTAQGTPTSVAATQIRAALVELSKDGSQTSNIFKEIAGVSFKEFIARGGNLQQALQLLEKHASEAGVGVNDMFSSVEAGNAALGLTGKGTEAFTNALNEMATAEGATAAAAETMAGSFDHLQGQTAASFEKLKILIGEGLEPGARSALEFANKTLGLASALIELGNAAEEATSDLVQNVESQSDAEEVGRKLAQQLSENRGFFAGISGATQDLTGAMEDLAMTHGDFSGNNEQLRASLEELFGTTVTLEKGVIKVDGAVLAHAESLRQVREETILTAKTNEQGKDLILELGQAYEIVDEKLAFYAQNQAVATRKEQERIDHLRKFTDGAGEASGAQDMLNNSTDHYAEASQAYRDSIEAASKALAEHNAKMGDYFVSAVNASDGIGFFNESAAQMADRTILVSNLTGDQQRALEDLQGEYQKAQDTIFDYTQGAKGVGMETEKVNEAVEAQQKRMAELEVAMQPLINAGGELANVQGTATINQEAVNSALFEAANASDASAVQLAILGGALGIYSEEATNAALQSALIQEKIDQLAQAYVAGDMSVAQMREELAYFIEDVGNVAGEMVTTAQHTEELTGSMGSLGGELGTASAAAIATANALNEIPSDINVHIGVTSDPVPTFPTGPGGSREPVHVAHGITDFVVPPGFEDDSFPFSAQTGEIVNVTTASEARKGGGGTQAPITISVQIDARGAAPGVALELEAAGNALSAKLGRDINRMRRGD